MVPIHHPPSTIGIFGHHPPSLPTIAHEFYHSPSAFVAESPMMVAQCDPSTITIATTISRPPS
jgi:hypothetical protein